MLPASGSYFCKMQIIMPAWPTFLDYCEDSGVKVLYKCKVLLYPLLSTLRHWWVLIGPTALAGLKSDVSAVIAKTR